MQLLDIVGVGTDYVYRWPGDAPEPYPLWVDYRAIANDGEHKVRIGFGMRHVYGRDRKRVVVWIDGNSQAQFLSADDFEVSGEVLSEIKVRGKVGEPICRYPDDPIAKRYAGLPIVGVPTRVSGSGVHNAWAVVASIADHRTIFALAALRRVERHR